MLIKRELPLKWRLTSYVLAVWVVVVIIFTVVFQILSNRIDRRLQHTMERQMIADANAVAANIEFEVATGETTLLGDKVKQHLQSGGEDIHSISVLKKDRSILYSSNSKSEISEILAKFGSWQSGTAKILGNRMVGIVPIVLEEGKTGGSVVYIKSLDGYLSDKRLLSLGVILTGMFGLLFTLLAAYWIGSRTSRPINHLVEASGRIADGDLADINIQVEGSMETKRLAESIRSTAEALQSQVLAIKKLTREISEVSTQTEGTLTNLASSATEQAAAVNETAATVEEMEKAGQSSAGNAKQIVSAAEKTAEASAKGRQTVEKTYEIIMQIKDESQDILDKSRNLLNAVEEVGTVIQSVNSISEQSKILAVNASIEAAKAGEYGSGFAVVAQEVKELAQQSKDATVQITGTLTAIRSAIEAMVTTARSGKERTEEGVNTIAHAGSVMNDLSEAIRENSNFANVIATNIKQQTVGLTQIAAAIEEINTTALDNQSISRSIAEGMRQMNNSLQLLSREVDRWRTPDETENASA